MLGVTRAFSGGMSAMALGWGLAAAGFGTVFAIRAGIAFLNDDEDYVEIFSVLSAFMLLLFALAAFAWWGSVAALCVIAARSVAAGGRRRERRRHVMESRERREAIRRRGRSNADQHPVGTGGSTVDPEERLAQLRAWEEQHPITRRGVAERARSFDGDPWKGSTG